MFADTYDNCCISHPPGEVVLVCPANPDRVCGKEHQFRCNAPQKQLRVMNFASCLGSWSRTWSKSENHVSEILNILLFICWHLDLSPKTFQCKISRENLDTHNTTSMHMKYPQGLDVIRNPNIEKVFPYQLSQHWIHYFMTAKLTMEGSAIFPATIEASTALGGKIEVAWDGWQVLILVWSDNKSSPFIRGHESRSKGFRMTKSTVSYTPEEHLNSSGFKYCWETRFRCGIQILIRQAYAWSVLTASPFRDDFLFNWMVLIGLTLWR